MDKYIKYQFNGKTHEIILTNVESTIHVEGVGESRRGVSGNPSHLRNSNACDWERAAPGISEIRYFIPMAYIYKMEDVKPVDNEGLPTEWEFA